MPRKCKDGELCLNSFTIIIIILIFLVLLMVTKKNNIIIMPQSNNNNSKKNNRFNNYQKIRQPASPPPSPPPQTINIHPPEQNKLSYWGYVNGKSTERVINPTLPPERSYEQTYNVPINIPTRGVSGGFQQVGILYKESVDSEESQIGNNNDSVVLPLYGRPTYPGSNKWTYYTSSDKYHTVKMPISNNGKECNNDIGCNEIYDGELITLPAYNSVFKVQLYNYDKPRYLPHVI